nr:hypothetical protein [Kribbella sindirgiensis]
MGEALASFRDLKGIGPATEARLHETGVYTWEALAAAAAALASVRDSGDTLREIAGAVAARRTEENGGEADAHAPGGGERLEAFVLRMSLSACGEPRRCEVTHVRSMAEKTWVGWRPNELTGFVQKHAKIRPEPAPHKESADKEPADKEPADKEPADKEPADKEPADKEPADKEPADTEPADTEPVVQSSRQRKDAPSEQPSSADHLVVLDAGKAIGGTSRDIDLVVTNTRSAGGAFGYRATLAARGLGAGQNGDGWINLATRTGTGSAGTDLALGFQGVQVPSGIQRLQLRLEVSLPGSAKRPPALSLA